MFPSPLWPCTSSKFPPSPGLASPYFRQELLGLFAALFGQLEFDCQVFAVIVCPLHLTLQLLQLLQELRLLQIGLPGIGACLILGLYVSLTLSEQRPDPASILTYTSSVFSASPRPAERRSPRRSLSGSTAARAEFTDSIYDSICSLKSSPPK